MEIGIKEIQTKNIEIPSRIFYANPDAAIKSILGDDIEIIKVDENHILLPNQRILVNVQYKSFDFNNFELFEITSSKRLSQLSDKYISDEIKNVRTQKIIKLKVMVNFNENENKKHYITLKNYDSIDYSLFGKEITFDNVFHAYCSVFDSYYFSYHGSYIEPILKDDEAFASLITSSKIQKHGFLQFLHQ